MSALLHPPEFWHARYAQQAQWTSELRRYIFERSGLSQAQRVLEVGCGTGVILAELTLLMRGLAFGVDIAAENLLLAMRYLPGAALANADALALPFSADSFDITLCHFLLLWLPDPLQAVREMVRVTRPGGYLLALAEPDYGGRIDFPDELTTLGQWQADALRRQGADPCLGRKLRAILHRAGLSDVHSGVLGGQWAGPPDVEALQLEWQTLQADLGPSATLSNLYTLDQAAWQAGERVLYVPTFFAWGRVPFRGG